jgi:hypothetical protein
MAALKSTNDKEEFLMTREYREKKLLANYVKFAKVKESFVFLIFVQKKFQTNIRVRFPDRYELQATFLSSEGTLHLIDFLRGSQEIVCLLFCFDSKHKRISG